MNPDGTDWRILEELQRDGRVSYAELAKAGVDVAKPGDRAGRGGTGRHHPRVHRVVDADASGSRSWRCPVALPDRQLQAVP